MDKQGELVLREALNTLLEWKNDFGAWNSDSTLDIPDRKMRSVFSELTDRLKGNYPFHHPVYAGQMLKPPHEIARAAYTLAMHINPNNHALDGGPPSSEMEKEVVAEFARFFGYGDIYLGHLTASGTIGNLEALWISRQEHPGKKIAFSSNAHYTHSRMCGVLGVDSCTITLDEDGAFNLDTIDPAEIGTIVVTLGTTGLGDVEPLHQIVPWAKEHNIRIHIDAAYGGFFRILKDSDIIDGIPWNLMHEADSIVIDPHKHGLQPYGCGCVIFKNPEVGRHYKHDSPYTYFTSDDLHLGEISLECSRAGAAAVALWATLKCFPLKEKEGFGPIMKKCREAALDGFSLIQHSSKLHTYKKPELDILTYFPATQEVKTTSEISELSQRVFKKGMDNRSYYLSLYKIPASVFCRSFPHFKKDSDTVTILRSVLMKPEHADFIQQLIQRIESAI